MAVHSFMLKIVGTTAILSVLVLQSPALAQSGDREAQIVVDAETNSILYENNAQQARRPASITKVMTLYLLFDALKRGSLTWDDRIVFSRNAASQPPTKLFVAAGNSIPVQTAVEALVLRSANDVATAVAERLGGSEGNFAQMMTSKARELGMSSTTFRNASGLPNATQRTTAEDLARLAIAIQRDFPEQYHWFSSQQMSWNGQTITGHNHLMNRMAGMDGLKTGYTNASGFNLAATTQRNGRRIVTVVLGGANRFQRDDLVEALTESAFRELGIGATQFAANITAYDVNFRDERDAADAAALIMDLPPRRVATAGISNIAMARSGRRLGFERGAPTFQVEDMTTYAPSRSLPTRTTAMAQRDDIDASATDEGETEVVRSAPLSGPVPFRVAIAPSARPVPVRTSPVTTSNPVPAPVVVPMRQMAHVEIVSPEPAPLRGSSTKADNGKSDNGLPSAETMPATSAQPVTSEMTKPNDVKAPSEIPAEHVTETTAEAAAADAPAQTVSPEINPPTQMAELAQKDAADLASASGQSGALNGSITMADATPAATMSSTTASAADPVATSEAAPAQIMQQSTVQMADLTTDAVVAAQQRQADANAREQLRIEEAHTNEATRREAARVQAAAAARVLAERQGNERRAERQLAEARTRTQKEKEARELAVAERQAAQERAVAAREENTRQAELARARNARGTAVVQVGAFKDKDDANAAIAQFARFFPSFAQREVSSVSRRDGIWYRARFAGLGALAAREACTLVSGRGGACQIVGD